MYAAWSLEIGVVHRREIDEIVLLLSETLLPSFVMLSLVLSVTSTTVAWHSDACFSFRVSCGADGVDGVERFGYKLLNLPLILLGIGLACLPMPIRVVSFMQDQEKFRKNDIERPGERIDSCVSASR